MSSVQSTVDEARMQVNPPRPGERGRWLPPMGNVAAVAAGGMIGAVLRVGFVVVFPNSAGQFPWTTFVENVVGAFLLGWVLVMLLERWRPRWSSVQPFLCTGVLGSFTTFSNFSVEWTLLANDGRLWLAVGYPAASVAAGLAAAGLGMLLARRMRPAGRGSSRAAPGSAEREGGA
ncbi:CrcB family protein [Phycisphaerales bacterium AB-hyl4]|uniref:Fluoride-specific ion channel FluC n=1 Tax=Natronomicrosphaera hydrolytica TaxID=3242702 RepID=A0ABV4U3K6_9BACT